jgi:cytochrome bd-type quinol oxidase subunit 2
VRLGQRIALTIVVAAMTTVAFGLGLAVSFALWPLGVVIGAAVVAGAPLLAVRTLRLLHGSFRAVSAQPVLLSVWIALAAAIGILHFASVSATSGDAFNLPWMIGMSFAIVVGTIVGVAWESERQSARARSNNEMNLTKRDVLS